MGVKLLHLPLLGHHHHQKKKKVVGTGSQPVAPPSPAKGWIAILVGLEGEEPQRFLVPVGYLNHPLFIGLLKEVEKEYGFEQLGPISIPCHVEYFRHVRGIIDRDNASAACHGSHYRFPLPLCFRA